MHACITARANTDFGWHRALGFNAAAMREEQEILEWVDKTDWYPPCGEALEAFPDHSGTTVPFATNKAVRKLGRNTRGRSLCTGRR